MRTSDFVTGFALLFTAGMATSASAYELRCRFVERIGNVDVVLFGNELVNDGNIHNIRMQIGVFDNAVSAAPAGGIVGWNIGSLTVTGAPSEHRRNNGRLSPFNFATGPNSNGNPPLPAGDPFTQLTEIDATLGTQSPIWNTCNPDGTPSPQPAAVVRGRNTYVSVYAFSTRGLDGRGYQVTATGNLIAATEWREVGSPTPPDCSDPANPVPGSVTYAPFPTAPQSFVCVFTGVPVPTPGAAGAMLAFAMVSVARRRR